MPEKAIADAESDQLERLPRGRHNLTREQVEGSQRVRIMRAMAEAVGELGYVKTTVAEVLKRAGVSRETFYAQFDDKHDCFMAAFDRSAEEMINRMTVAFEQVSDSDGSEEERISMMLASFLNLLAEEPGIARTYYVEVYAAGQEAIEHRVDIQMGIVDLMMGMVVVADEDRFSLQATMAAIGAIVTQVVSLGQTENLPHLQPQLLQFVMNSLRGINAKSA
jgi:AcrR family transcriptional regulator